MIAGLVTLAGLLLKAWLTSAPECQKEAADAKTLQGRLDIGGGGVDAVSVRVDNILRGETPCNPPGLGDDQDTARRLAEITNK